MIERLKKACQADERLVAALMFGSFTTGEGDANSDIEFALFLCENSYEDFDARAWLSKAVGPVAAYFPDSFGHHTALFANGVRCEVHVMAESEIPVIASWKGYGWFPSLGDAVLVDRNGELSRYASELVGGPPERGGAELVENLMLNLVNLSLFGANLLNRGEWARAWALLGQVHDPLLKLARLSEGATEHWPTPSRALEQDIGAPIYARYIGCTAGADPKHLAAAYRATWGWSLELFEEVAVPLALRPPAVIVERIGALLSAVPVPTESHPGQ